MSRVKRVDTVQPAIVAALREIGATVQHLHTVGQGCPDLLVGYRGANYLLEVKTVDGKLTGDEARWIVGWRGRVIVVRTVEDALRAIGLSEVA